MSSSEDSQLVNTTEAGLYETTIKRLQGSAWVVAQDILAEETPVALEYNGLSHVVMMMTPQALTDFALGFSLTEGILKNQDELYDVEIKPQALGIVVSIEIASERFLALKAHRRNLTGRTGCGLCGAERLEQVFKTTKSASNTHHPLNLATSLLFKAMADLPKHQRLQQTTGATHACAWVNKAGEIGMVREDVGRHNSMDKLLGALAKQDFPVGYILTTSRASYEMVQKIAMVGYDCLVAVSAPTGLAVRLAEQSNVTLLGFVRGQQCVVYSHENRVG